MSYFYQPDILTNPILEGEEFLHCTKVLRKKPGDEIHVLDGKGHLFQVTIDRITKNQCELSIRSQVTLPEKPFYTHLAVAPTKSMDRMEWMVEKTCELGIDEITFIQTAHSERNKINPTRLEKKAISALKQSKNGYLTRINPLIRFSDFIYDIAPETDKLIAIVREGLPYITDLMQPNTRVVILIGPEGDFTEAEQSQASKTGFRPISLGKSVLRTETAGLIACHFVNVINHH